MTEELSKERLSMVIYIASSWRNQHAVEMLTALLRQKSHTVRSFVESNYEDGLGKNKGMPFDEWLETRSAERAFRYDIAGSVESDLVIYLSPSGTDAWAEVGAAWASSVPIYGLYAKGEQARLMRKMVSRWFERYENLLDAVDDLENVLLKSEIVEA